MGIAIILVGVILGAATGIVGATIVTLRLLTLPALIRRGYSRPLACGTVCASVTLGQIIRPSLILILLSDILGQSVGTMFAAAVVPGMLLAAIYMLAFLALAALRPDMAPAIDAEERAAMGSWQLVRKFALVVLPSIVLGFFLEWIEISYIALPLFLPFFIQNDVNLVWLGALICLNLQTSFMTPPFGWSLFFLKGVAPPRVTTGDIYRGVVPFIALQIVALAILFVFPALALWLPDAIGW